MELKTDNITSKLLYYFIFIFIEEKPQNCNNKKTTKKKPPTHKFIFTSSLKTVGMFTVNQYFRLGSDIICF
jgi:hypothetical protein